MPAGLPDTVGATHFQEVAFVFDNIEGLGYASNPFQGKPQSYVDLANLMSSSWIRFIHDLDPNSGSNGRGPLWPKYNGQDPRNIVWEATTAGLVVIEKDDFRSTGIKLISDNLATVYKI